MRRELAIGLAAIALNGGLFLVIASANCAVKSTSVAKDARVLEVFYVAPAAPQRAPLPREILQAGGGAAGDVSQPTTEPAAPPSGETEAFEPRSAPTAFIDPGLIGMATGPSVRVAFGPPRGSETGAVGGTPGGTGSGGSGGPGVYGVSQVDRPPERTFAPLPPYPHWGRMQRLEAVVTVHLVIGEDGSVLDASVEGVEGDPRFGKIACEGVREWRFEPAVSGGRRVPCAVIQRVRFRLVD